MDTKANERWFEIELPQPGIRSIIVGTELGGFRIYIHGTDPGDRFEGGDTIQDRVSHLIRILRNDVRGDCVWLDYDTRDAVHVWDALAGF